MKTCQGIGASEGIAIGPAYLYLPQLPPIEKREVENAAQELERLQSAVAKVEADLDDLITQVQQDLGQEEAAIFEAHRMFLSDKAFVGRITDIITNDLLAAEAAIEKVTDELKQTFEAMEGEYFRERAMDVVD
ncbi:MAG: phosphoenolpyruvate--protein phosphotransferase, partial [Anaerolineales bacterium]|nr:phosphoenolpyruvate--protein phosphotransferase [Anaerolineales bacterium]